MRHATPWIVVDNWFNKVGIVCAVNSQNCQFGKTVNRQSCMLGVCTLFVHDGMATAITLFAFLQYFLHESQIDKLTSNLCNTGYPTRKISGSNNGQQLCIHEEGATAVRMGTVRSFSHGCGYR